MIKVLLFASLREAVGQHEWVLALPEDVDNAKRLIDFLADRNPAWTVLKTFRNLRVAINQEMAGQDAAIKDGDEIAFFPPVTGG